MVEVFVHLISKPSNHYFLHKERYKCCDSAMCLRYVPPSAVAVAADTIVTPKTVSKMCLQEGWLWAVDAWCASTMVMGWLLVVSAQGDSRGYEAGGGCGVLNPKIQ